ncbi:tetratricopeptide repeat protein, partial [Streptomyces sp. YC504]|nr:tetratricopeptide repeat protein [Streptomyces mesophilus]
MSLTDPQEIQQAIYHNSSNPYGPARSARAEELCAAAERSGDAGLLRQALSALVDAYTWSSERTKALVPFARLLQEYDRDPGAFDRWGTHSLFWSFKWVTGDIIDVPEVSIPDVEHWFADMERRYRLAGHSERAVRQCEFYLAESTGDLERADRAVAAWTAAERDAMSNCHACELGTQGRYWAARGEDEKALEVWRPVTDGGKSCKEEPHRVLAHTLLPLLRLGRFREARTHHLKGYHLVRGDDSLLRSVGQHIEFCALTGNEARGLEILAEHAAQLGPLADVDAQLSLNGGVLVLLRRLKELGHGDLETVRYAGAPRTAAELYELLYAQAREIAGRFDLRNGNAHISGRFEERIAREPLVDTLPLGVRGLRLRAGS